MIVARARSGSMGEEAGIRQGDVVVAIDDRSVRSLREVRAALASVGEVATFTLAGGTLRTARVQRKPTEASVLYDTIDGRLRALVTRPPGRSAAVLLTQGISLASIEDSAPFRALVDALPDFVTMRIDKSGVGDSLGEVPDFAQELADFGAALHALSRYDFVDPNAIFVFGHSVGGMIAPLLRDGVAGIAVYGTTARRWYTCLAESSRRQAELCGRDPTGVAERQREVIARGEDERSLSFHEQLEAVDLAAAWRSVRCPTLVLHGEFDWVVSRDESRGVAELSSGRFDEVEGLDHTMTRHDGLAASLEAYGRGAIDRSPGDEIARFFRACLQSERTRP